MNTRMGPRNPTPNLNHIRQPLQISFSALIKPPKSLRHWPIPQLLRRNIPHIDLPLLLIPRPIIRHHPRAQQER